MSSFDVKSGIPYENWIQSSEQPAHDHTAHDWAATRAVRHRELKELLAPFKEPLKEAVAEFSQYLNRIDQALAEFLKAEEASIAFHRRHTTLFNELRLPAELATPMAQALLSEYAALAVCPSHPKLSVAEAIAALEILKADIQPQIESERMRRALEVVHARQRLLVLLNDAGPLNAIASLVDTQATSANTLFLELQDRLRALAAIVSPSNTQELPAEQLQHCLDRLQESFELLIRMTTSYHSPGADVVCDQLVMANLREVVQNLYPKLRPPAFTYANANVSQLPMLARDEKQAYLVVTRHLDVCSTAVEAHPEFARIAAQERDELLEDLIRRCEVAGATDLIMPHAAHMAEDCQQLKTSLRDLILRVNARIEEDLVRIQCETELDEELARYLARQSFCAGDLREVLALFINNSDLRQSFVQMLRAHDSMPSREYNQLHEYLITFAGMLSVARKVSPLLLEAILRSPEKELETKEGVERRQQELQALKENPEKLRAQELSWLVSLTASLLESNFSAPNHVAEQYRIAAEIVVFGLAPQMKNAQLERPVRDCGSVVGLVSRNSGSPRSVAIINQTIQSHLIPHLLVCKNESESNPVKRRYQLQRALPENLMPVMGYLEHIAKRPVVVRKKAVTSPSTAAQGVALNDTKTAKRELEVNRTQADIQEQERQQQYVQIAALRRLLSVVEEKYDEIVNQARVTLGHTETARQLQVPLGRVEILATRLSSSLHNGLSFREQSSYSDELDSFCFARLREMVGLRRLGMISRGNRVKAKRISAIGIKEVIVDGIAQKYPDTLLFLEDGRKVIATLRETDRQLSNNAVQSVAEASTKARVAIAACIGGASLSDPERAVMLNHYCRVVSNPALLENVRCALKELRHSVRRKLEKLVATTSDQQNVVGRPKDEAVNEKGVE